MIVTRARNTCFTLLLTSVLGAPLCLIGGSVFAQDTSCQPVFNAALRAATTPHHSYTTMKAAVAGMPTTAESIYDGKNNYFQYEGKWKLSPLTPKDMVAQEQDNIKNTKSTCRLLREETIDGVSAILFSTHEERDGDTTDGQVWLSKSDGLLVHVRMAEGADTRYVYSGVTTPAL
jgi:hypothetical protein